MEAGTIGDTLDHALFLAEHLHRCDLQYMALAVLFELRVPRNYDGFDYLKNAILLYHDNPVQKLSKELYPAIGKMYEQRPGKLQVEQAIRSAINAAWKDRNEKVWRIYFQADGDGRLKKPSNAELIADIALFLKLWQGCCQEVSYEK